MQSKSSAHTRSCLLGESTGSKVSREVKHKEEKKDYIKLGHFNFLTGKETGKEKDHKDIQVNEYSAAT